MIFNECERFLIYNIKVMISRVKLYADYRKEISLLEDTNPVLDYTPKHLMSKSEIHDKKIENQVKTLNEYEEKRNAFQKLYFKKRLIYFSIVTVITLCLLAGMIYFGIRAF